MRTLSVKELARILSEEFARDGWGDIPPYLFDYVAKGGYEEDDAEDAAGLEQVLERVVARIRR